MSESRPAAPRRMGPVANSLSLACAVFALECFWLSLSSPPVEVNRQAIEVLAFLAFAGWLWSLPFAFSRSGRQVWLALLGLPLGFGAPILGLGLMVFSCAKGVCF